MSKKYYSQFGQDKWVIEKIFNHKKDGFFLDLAAGDGVCISNTYALEKDYGWQGICIEAHEGHFDKLKNNRKCFCDNSCIDGKRHKVNFVNRAGDDMLGILTPFCSGIVDEDTGNKFADPIRDDFVIKETVTLLDILKKYDASKVIDYFSFDVEGAETRILKDFPFDEYTFLSMSIERPSNLLNKILAEKEYVLVGIKDIDALYVHKSVFKNLSLKSLRMG